MNPLLLHKLGTQPYLPVWRAMQLQVRQRHSATPDALWQVEHPWVITLGRHAQRRHLRRPGAIPVVRVDRGGQVSLHGPGQVVYYVLLDLRRRGLGVRSLVSRLESAMIHTLADLGIDAYSRADAPGVYVHGAKIGALGLRIRGGYSMHGLALNVSLPVQEFARMHPCGLIGQSSTSLWRLGQPVLPQAVAERLAQWLAKELDAPLTPMPALPTELVQCLAIR